jgi:putative nucleotidyltransferase with HDIG domain
MMKDIDIVEKLARYLPSIKQVDEVKTAVMIAQVWLKALKMSSWETIDQAKFKEGMDDITLISHVNSTVECALALSHIISKYHKIHFDEQIIIVLGLLHDVDKVVEYVYNAEGELIISDIGKKIQHGVLTAMLAREVGFGLDMQHMIITHTNNQNMKPIFKEAILFGHADICDWEMTCRFSE